MEDIFLSHCILYLPPLISLYLLFSNDNNIVLMVMFSYRYCVCIYMYMYISPFKEKSTYLPNNTGVIFISLFCIVFEELTN